MRGYAVLLSLITEFDNVRVLMSEMRTPKFRLTEDLALDLLTAGDQTPAWLRKWVALRLGGPTSIEALSGPETETWVPEGAWHHLTKSPTRVL